MDVIKIPVNQLKEELVSCAGKDRYSHSAWTKKLPKGVLPCDHDKVEKLIEIEYPNGNRVWVGYSSIFGKVITEVKNILILYTDGATESLSIVDIEAFKVKRSFCLKLIFERD